MSGNPWRPPRPPATLPADMPSSYRVDLPERPVDWSWAPDAINSNRSDQ